MQHYRDITTRLKTCLDITRTIQKNRHSHEDSNEILKNEPSLTGTHIPQRGNIFTDTHNIHRHTNKKDITNKQHVYLRRVIVVICRVRHVQASISGLISHTTGTS